MTTRRPGKPASQRQLRIGEELRHILAEILFRGELRDPDIQGRTVTVTEVRISPDLKNATAYIVPLGGEYAPEILGALRRSSAFLRGRISQSVNLRYAPQIGFELDRTFDQAQKIDMILQRPDVRKDLLPRNSDDEPPVADGS